VRLSPSSIPRHASSRNSTRRSIRRRPPNFSPICFALMPRRARRGQRDEPLRSVQVITGDTSDRRAASAMFLSETTEGLNDGANCAWAFRDLRGCAAGEIFNV
jgi:hypothetical protein